MRSFLPFLFVLAACSTETVVAAPTETPLPEPTPVTPQPSRITWASCSLETGGTDTLAECADIEVPLDWSKPDGKKVTYFVKRLLGSAQGPHKQLWLLQGGPGSAGDGLEPFAKMLVDGNGALDVYVPDHRGTGRSAYLSCPKAEVTGNWPRCLDEVEKEWGADGLATFSTTSAARDLGHAIELAKTDGQEIHVYGVSYGTYLAQRYLQIFPTQPTSVTLDSVCQSGLCSLLKYDYYFDRTAKEFLAECAADAFCGGKLGPDPVQKVRDAIAVADAGTCAGLSGWTAETMRSILGYFVASVTVRPAIPAIVHRTLRCNADDVSALQNMSGVLNKMFSGGQGFAPTRTNSTVLAYNIGFSEMEESPPATQAEIETLLEGAVFATGNFGGRAFYDAWPKYPRDEFVGKYPTTDAPVLLMNGTLDPQTPHSFAVEVATHYTKPWQTFVSFPRATHGTIASTPMPGGKTCGSAVFDQFLAAPKSALDTSCTQNLLPHDFGGHVDLAQMLFASPSLWGEDAPSPGGPGPAPFAPSKTFENARRELRLAVDLHPTRPVLLPRAR